MVRKTLVLLSEGKRNGNIGTFVEHFDTLYLVLRGGRVGYPSASLEKIYTENGNAAIVSEIYKTQVYLPLIIRLLLILV